MSRRAHAQDRNDRHERVGQGSKQSNNSSIHAIKLCGQQPRRFHLAHENLPAEPDTAN
jgi:hypothetical protein